MAHARSRATPKPPTICTKKVLDNKTIRNAAYRLRQFVLATIWFFIHANCFKDATLLTSFVKDSPTTSPAAPQHPGHPSPKQLRWLGELPFLAFLLPILACG